VDKYGTRMTVTSLQRDVMTEKSWHSATPTHTVASGIVWVTLTGPDHEEVKLYVPADKAPPIGSVFMMALTTP
jgi:hypothetical protein